jgi:hypothetical protein
MDKVIIKNKELANYIGKYLIQEIEEAEPEDLEVIDELIFQALEAYEAGTTMNG